MTGVANTYANSREMLEKEQLDAVRFRTPNYSHAEVAVTALEKRLDVLVEKAIATPTKDAKAVVATAKRTRGHLMVGYAFRCTPRWRAVHAAVADGKISTIRQWSAIAFIDVIANGGENPADSEEGVWPMALTKAAYRSAVEKTIVRIESQTEHLTRHGSSDADG